VIQALTEFPLSSSALARLRTAMAKQCLMSPNWSSLDANAARGQAPAGKR
jgi:hypothetical protein